MASPTPPSRRTPTLRSHGPWIALGLVSLAIALAVAATSTALSASSAAGAFVGTIVGGSIVLLLNHRMTRHAAQRHRRDDAATLDQLEPLRPDRST